MRILCGSRRYGTQWLIALHSEKGSVPFRIFSLLMMCCSFVKHPSQIYAGHLKLLFRDFHVFSRLDQVSRRKSVIYFANSRVDLQETMASLLHQVHPSNQIGSIVFSKGYPWWIAALYILDKMNSTLAGWCARVLSYTGHAMIIFQGLH